MTITNDALAKVLDGADHNVRIQDDLFRAVNGSWLRTSTIPDDLSSVGGFVSLSLQAEDQVREIIEDLSAREPSGGQTQADAAQPDQAQKDVAQTNETQTDPAQAAEAQAGQTQTAEARKIASLFNSWMDVDSLDAKGIAPLEEDLRAVDECQSHAQLARAVGALMATGVGSFFDYSVTSDPNDPERYVTFVWQSGIGLPDEAYYREEQHAQTLAQYREFVSSFLELAMGMDAEEAAASAGVILRLETAIAASHMSVVDSRDTDKINNPYTWAEFLALAPGFDWKVAFDAAGAPELEDLLVTSPDALAAASALWSQTELEELKTYTRWRILRARAMFLTQRIDRANFDFYGRVLSGATEQRERWKRGVDVVEGALGEAVGKEYVARHFPPSHKAKMLQLVEDLLEAYRQSITELDWMSQETKARALEKLDAFVTKIGYPETWRDYSALEIGEDLVANVRAAARHENARQFAKLGTPVDRSEWLMSPQTVNAYYFPLWNEIAFPAAILQFPFFDPDRDDALNYGAIGAVIGHEIGHGFDDQGSKYDASGAIEDWWTERDRQAFEDRTSALIAQYDAYVPAQFGDDPAHHVQGALTIGENIGDLGGISIGLKAYGIALARQGKSLADAPVIDGYTGVQRVFLSYARVWQAKLRDERLKTLIATDPHSPAEFRTNGVVKNVDAFAEAFGLDEGDGLYLPPDERVRIW